MARYTTPRKCPFCSHESIQSSTYSRHLKKCPQNPNSSDVTSSSNVASPSLVDPVLEPVTPDDSISSFTSVKQPVSVSSPYRLDPAISTVLELLKRQQELSERQMNQQLKLMESFIRQQMEFMNSSMKKKSKRDKRAKAST